MPRPKPRGGRFGGSVGSFDAVTASSVGQLALSFPQCSLGGHLLLAGLPLGSVKVGLVGTVREIGTGRRSSAPAISVGLIAHDSKKESLARFMRAHRRVVSRFRFIAPEDTATAVADVPLNIEVLAPDTQGGDLQLAAAVVEGRLDAVIFLNDPLAALPSEPLVATMMKVCDLEPIPMVTNVAAAEVLVHHLERMAAQADAKPVAEGEELPAPVERLLILKGPWPEGGHDPAAHR